VCNLCLQPLVGLVDIRTCPDQGDDDAEDVVDNQHAKYLGVGSAFHPRLCSHEPAGRIKTEFLNWRSGSDMAFC